MKITSTPIALMLLTSLLLFASCSGKKEKSNENADSATQTEQSGNEQLNKNDQTFPYPDIPAMISEPDQRRHYLLTHFWSNYDFSDTTLMSNGQVSEQALVNFLSLLQDPSTSESERTEALDAYAKGLTSTPDAIRIMGGNTERYLYQADSPMHDEELFDHYLTALLKALPDDSPYRFSANDLKTLIAKNKVGTIAEDFTYITPDKKERSLHKTPIKGGLLLIYFYDPDCENCDYIHSFMIEPSGIIERLGKAGKLTLLAVNTQESDEHWKRVEEKSPNWWLHGYDRLEITYRSLYDLKAMPTFYLLDSKKCVLLKDPTLDQLIYYLENSAK